MPPNQHVRTVVRSLRTTVSLAQAEQLPFLAAAIAYYAFLSVVPLLIVSFAVASTLAGEAVATQLFAATDEFLTPEAGELLTEALVAAPGREGMTLAGSVVLVWGTLRVFRGLDTAFARVYGSTIAKPLLEQLRDALVVVFAIGAAVAVTLVVGSLPVVFGVSLAGVLGPLGLVAVLPLVFFPLYYVFPARDVTVCEAVPGALLAAGGWALLGTLFGVYTTYAGSFQLYGVLGGVLLLLIWFYFGGLILLVGVAVNAAVSGRFEDRQLQHEPLRERNQRATMADADGPTEEDDWAADERPDEPTDRSAADEPTSRAQTERAAVTRDDDLVRRRRHTLAGGVVRSVPDLRRHRAADRQRELGRHPFLDAAANAGRSEQVHIGGSAAGS